MSTYNSTEPGEFNAEAYETYLKTLNPEELIEECTKSHELLEDLFERMDALKEKQK